MTKSKNKSWPKLLSIWMNAIGNAWNMGDASWAFEDGQSVAVRLWAKTFAETGDEYAASEAVMKLAQEHGIDPKVHKSKLA